MLGGSPEAFFPAGSGYKMPALPCIHLWPVTEILNMAQTEEKHIKVKIIHVLSIHIHPTLHKESFMNYHMSCHLSKLSAVRLIHAQATSYLTSYADSQTNLKPAWNDKPQRSFRRFPEKWWLCQWHRALLPISSTRCKRCNSLYV